MGRLLCAFPVVLKQYLRGAESIDASVAHLLDEADRASLMRTRNKPLHACNLLAQTVSSVPETPFDETGGTFGRNHHLRVAPALAADLGQKPHGHHQGGHRCAGLGPEIRS